MFLRDTGVDLGISLVELGSILGRFTSGPSAEHFRSSFSEIKIESTYAVSIGKKK